MKTKILWLNINDFSHLNKIKEWEKVKLFPIFLNGNSDLWLEGLTKLGYPYYGGMMRLEWFEEQLSRFSSLILIGDEEFLNRMNPDLFELMPEWEMDNERTEPYSFLEDLQPLKDVIIRLLGPGGCSYDRKQTHRSLRRNLIEETYEVLEAIEEENYELLKEELGDLLLQIVFHAQLAEESGHFDLKQVVEEINQKLVRRHPHVFGEERSLNSAAALASWEEIKSQEKGKRERRILDGIPMGLPALLEALKMQEKASKVGFDWSHLDDVWKKWQEEKQELEEANSMDEQEDELGDLFFVLVNVSRFLKINPELALAKANRKFLSRFNQVEAFITKGARGWDEYSLEELEALWVQAKK